jgi:hypothetical protein
VDEDGDFTYDYDEVDKEKTMNFDPHIRDPFDWD